VKINLIFVGLLLLASGVAGQHHEPRASGVIYGVAIGQDGRPAKGIGLTARPLGVALGAMLPRVAANDKLTERRMRGETWLLQVVLGFGFECDTFVALVEAKSMRETE
jgi:hypothetical protein